MDKEFRENVRNVFLKIVKKNKHLKEPMLFFLTVVLTGYYSLRHFKDNGKRYAGVGFVVLFFMLNSSFAFSFPMEDESASISDSTESIGKFDEASVMEDAEPVLINNQEAPVATEVIEETEEVDFYRMSEHHGLEDEDQYTLEDILEENEEYGDSINSESKREEGTETEFNSDDWRLVLINKQHPIPDDYTFELVTIKGSMQCDGRIREELFAMLQGAKDNDINLVIRSPYRDMSRQEYLFNRKIKSYMQKKMSYMDAYKIASQTVTVPGASEHQIGLAIDITSDGYAALDRGFGDTEAGKWLAEHSCEYGFILRYPAGKENITGIEYEPWHFRYVGKEAATIIMEEGITLEEFTESYL